MDSDSIRASRNESIGYNGPQYCSDIVPYTATLTSPDRVQPKMSLALLFAELIKKPFLTQLIWANQSRSIGYNIATISLQDHYNILKMYPILQLCPQLIVDWP